MVYRHMIRPFARRLTPSRGRGLTRWALMGFVLACVFSGLPASADTRAEATKALEELASLYANVRSIDVAWTSARPDGSPWLRHRSAVDQFGRFVIWSSVLEQRENPVGGSPGAAGWRLYYTHSDGSVIRESWQFPYYEVINFEPVYERMKRHSIAAHGWSIQPLVGWFVREMVADPELRFVDGAPEGARSVLSPQMGLTLTFDKDGLLSARKVSKAEPGQPPKTEEAFSYEDRSSIPEIPGLLWPTKIKNVLVVNSDDASVAAQVTTRIYTRKELLVNPEDIETRLAFKGGSAGWIRHDPQTGKILSHDGGSVIGSMQAEIPTPFPWWSVLFWSGIGVVVIGVVIYAYRRARG
jgi:hypothetical protein